MANHSYAKVERMTRAGNVRIYTIRFRPGGVYHAVTRPDEPIQFLTGVHKRPASALISVKLLPRATAAIAAFKAKRNGNRTPRT